MTGSAPHWPIVVVPLILSADFGRFVEEVRAVDAAGAKVKFFGGTLSSDEDGFATAIDKLIVPHAPNGTGFV